MTLLLVVSPLPLGAQVTSFPLLGYSYQFINMLFLPAPVLKEKLCSTFILYLPPTHSRTS
jgi:hypothetical protein